MMKSLCFFAALAVPILSGQTATTGHSFQQNGWISFPGNASTVTVHNLRPDGQTGPVLGRPFSGTETRHTRQTLADGTNVDHIDSSSFYRDAQGRMRSESPNRVLIYDPIAGFTYNLDSEHKTYEKSPLHEGSGSTSIAVVGGSTWIKTMSEAGPHMPVESVHSTHGSAPFHGEPARPPDTEDLLVQTVNGIAAKGSRITITIPAATFGNDRDVKVVNERWYSDELQVLVKTVNTDPRFGVTTYDLTNVLQGMPDAALFQVPADYRLQSNSHHE